MKDMEDKGCKEYLKATPEGVFCGDKKILLRGMGLGNWFLPEGYMWLFYNKCDRPRRIEALVERLCGKEYAKQFWKEFAERYVTEEDIHRMAGWGINSVRLPLNARTLFVRSESGVAFKEEVIARVDACLLWCKKYGIYLILDMHGTFGGQTGTNIDDSEHDEPELFQKPEYQEILINCWRLLAERYKGESAIGGYDLMNEPLPEAKREYWPGVMPLYRRLIQAIREIDREHMIILEGVNWASNFSIFDEMSKEEASDNILLQFHKYWNHPDADSLLPFRETAKRLEVPLWMGEGGENNLDWYTTAFPMYEREGIGWCFWSYKKMETDNSPFSIRKPQKWDKILKIIDSKEEIGKEETGKEEISKEEAREIFEEYLTCVTEAGMNESVINALLRKAPGSIPAIAFDAEWIESEREAGVSFRERDKACILFADGHKGAPDWKRYGGEQQPESEQMLVRLRKGDCLGYHMEGYRRVEVEQSGDGRVVIREEEDGLVWVCCVEGEVNLTRILFE
ncbi:MAG: glycoside hydrolase family 5 protein [Acetatifactor sp.]|nr:glycoside hydrolase family 5 protein [Acetatifactor sp.]